VLDLGCGSGHKFVKFVVPRVEYALGVDQQSGIELASRIFPSHQWMSADFSDPTIWPALGDHHFDTVIWADVIEHLADPSEALANIRDVLATGSRLVVSTPDRSYLEEDPLGPPNNPRHIREWTEAELRLLLHHQGYVVEESHHQLPRSYSLSVLEAKRVAWRVLHARAIPDRRSSMLLVATRR
jgi:2-polyprenyl-3-methyl-5-hydroxy-6-metoxy-1,4-benzoquinol methylase